jgi:hypothetical protein
MRKIKKVKNALADMIEDRGIDLNLLRFYQASVKQNKEKRCCLIDIVPRDYDPDDPLSTYDGRPYRELLVKLDLDNAAFYEITAKEHPDMVYTWPGGLDLPMLWKSITVWWNGHYTNRI